MFDKSLLFNAREGEHDGGTNHLLFGLLDRQRARSVSDIRIARGVDNP